MIKKQLFKNYITENIDNAYRFAYSYVRNREDAEDIVSESVIKALKSVDKLKNTGKIKPWFYRIIANTSIDFINSRNRIIKSDLSEADKVIKTEDDYSRLTVDSIIESLDEKYKMIVILRFCEDMTIKEIGKVLNINENTVKTRLYSAMKQLEIEMEDM